MGSRISYVASPLSEAELAATFGFAEVRRVREMPYQDTCAFRTAAGWSVLWVNDETFAARHAETIARLSKRAPVLSLTVSETVMASQSDLHEDGALAWSIMHLGEDGPDVAPVISGTLPPAYEAIRARQADAQAADDGLVDHMFAVPVELASRLCGFRYDEMPEAPGGFAVLGPRRRGLLARLLGR